MMLLAFCIIPRRGRGGGTVGAVDILLRSLVQMVATAAIAVTAGNADGFGPISRPLPRTLGRHAVVADGSIPCPHLATAFASSCAGLGW